MLIITFHNDGTGDVTEGNYNYEVYINKELIGLGRLEKHNRLEGWEGLIKQFAKLLEEEE